MYLTTEEEKMLAFIHSMRDEITGLIIAQENGESISYAYDNALGGLTFLKHGLTDFAKQIMDQYAKHVKTDGGLLPEDMVFDDPAEDNSLHYLP